MMIYLIGGELYELDTQPDGGEPVGYPPDEFHIFDHAAKKWSPDPVYSPEHLARQKSKLERVDAVARIAVTTTSGRHFDGDETSQGRMARAIIGLQAAGVPLITWVLADNTAAEVTIAELTEALILSGQEQARLWLL